MEYPNGNRRCPVCNGTMKWACREDIGIRPVTKKTITRYVKNKEREGSWIIEVVILNGEAMVHSTTFSGDICYIWPLSDIAWEKGDFYHESYLDYEMDAD